jgi:LuxR family transcriptional regulator, maltose regulon positive regulatory protein
MELTMSLTPNAQTKVQGTTEPRSGPAASASAWALPLLATKLAFRAPSRPLVARPRLTARLQTTAACRLALVVAPAGSGKSSVVIQWSQESDASRVAWLSLDANDNDPIRFLRYLCAALERVAPEAGHPAGALLQSPECPPVEHVLTVLLNGLAALDRRVTLVLDDYEKIEAPSIHALLTLLLEHLPQTLLLILISRCDPPLPLARLRARGQMVELRALDLRFTVEETRRFLNESMGLELAPEAVGRLTERTEGWITGLQLAALSLQGRPDAEEFIAAFSGSHRAIVDYLVEEVLAREPEEVQAFLARTAFMERLCGPLCEAVTGEGQAMLERLEAANLFLIPLDEERRWYRYHPLFREALRARTQPLRAEEFAMLHERAAAWYEAQGMVGNVIQHPLGGEHRKRAATRVEPCEGPSWHSEHRTVERWRLAQPAAPVPARPAPGERGPDTEAASRSAASGLVEPLTERELEVLRLAAAELSNEAIAARLFLSTGTVKRHMHNIYGKLAVSGRFSAATRAQALNLL